MLVQDPRLSVTLLLLLTNTRAAALKVILKRTNQTNSLRSDQAISVGGGWVGAGVGVRKYSERRRRTGRKKEGKKEKTKTRRRGRRSNTRRRSRG